MSTDGSIHELRAELRELRALIVSVLGIGAQPADLITIKEAVRLTKFSARTIQRWLASGHLKARRSPAGKGVRIDRQELLSVLQEQKGV